MTQKRFFGPIFVLLLVTRYHPTKEKLSPLSPLLLCSLHSPSQPCCTQGAFPRMHWATSTALGSPGEEDPIPSSQNCCYLAHRLTLRPSTVKLRLHETYSQISFPCENTPARISKGSAVSLFSDSQGNSSVQTAPPKFPQL